MRRRMMVAGMFLTGALGFLIAALVRIARDAEGAAFLAIGGTFLALTATFIAVSGARENKSDNSGSQPKR